MIVTNLMGESELLVDFNNLKRVRKVNGDYSISFVLIKTDKNKHSYNLVEDESIIEYDGQEYRIKDVTEILLGDTPVKTVQAYHIFFDLVDTHKYGFLINTQTIQTCLLFALEGTGYTFDVIDSFGNVSFEKFGEDNSLSLVQTVLNTFGAEIKLDNKHLSFYRQIGIDTEVQIRYGYNIKWLEKNVNTNNLSTRIKGYGKQNDDGSYVTTAEYISPNAAIYGLRDAPPIYDERYTIQSELLERIKSELIDEPQIAFKVDALELKEIGVLTEQLNEGDRVFVIYEPLAVDLDARVLEIVDYPKSSTPAQYTFGNFQNSFIREVADFQKTKDRIDGIFDGTERLPYNVLPNAVKKATESLQSAETQLIFENGIIAVNPSNPKHLVLFNSNGIGISRDGGASFSEAITADGFVLSAGAIGQLNANNITVGAGSNFEMGYNPKDSSDQLEMWKYPGTTMINGGEIHTNSITTNKLLAGLLVGFTIRTSVTTDVPHVELTKDEITIGNGDRVIRIKAGDGTSGGQGGPIMHFIDGDEHALSEMYQSDDTFRIAADKLILAGINETEVAGDLNVIGAKNASVPTSIGNVNVSAYETAEYYFGDIGRGEIVEGKCTIEIESLFKETVNTNIDYEVFLTPYGRGIIFVDEMLNDRFIVKGDDILFAYEIKAKRNGYETVRLELSNKSEVNDFV